MRTTSTPVPAATAALAAGTWRLDRSRSSVEFHVPNFYGLMTVKGRFDRYEGTLQLNGRPAVALAIDADSLDTKHGKRDKHLRSADAAMREVDGELEVEASALADHRNLGMSWSPLGIMRAPSKLIVRGRLVRKEHQS